jgi:hypothetical protein
MIGLLIATIRAVNSFDGFDDLLAHFFGIAEQHHRIVAVEKLFFDPA